MLPQLLPFRGQKQDLNPRGQARSLNTLHSGSSISSIPWLSSTLLSGPWPLTSHTLHRAPAPERQLALKDKICVQGTRAIRLWGGDAAVQQFPEQAATDSAQSYERHLCVLPAVSASDIPAPKKDKHQVFGGCVRQRPGSCSFGVLCFQVCRDHGTVTIFHSVSLNQFICRLNRFISLCHHFYI